MNVISAGFCTFFADITGEVQVRAWGESVSLNIEGRGEVDAEIIKLQLCGVPDNDLEGSHVIPNTISPEA